MPVSTETSMDVDVDVPADVSSAPIITPLGIPPSTPFIPVLTDYREKRFEDHTPIIIDNGATNFRAGFADSGDPYVVVDNTVAKYRDRKTNNPVLLFGNELLDDATTRSNAKSPFDGDICVNPEAMEAALDWVFIKLGLDGTSVDHPVVMTERVCTPLQSRSIVSELLFEAYNVPSVLYGPDGYFSLLANSPTPTTVDGIVVSFNTCSTNLWPVLGGRALMSHAKRLPWGGTQAGDLMLRYIQLKYPNFPTRVSLSQAVWMMQNFCEFASPSYLDKVRELQDPLKLQAFSRVVQFPFAATTVEQKTEEELERLAEKRREAGRRLQETTARVRLERLAQKENDLRYYNDLKEWKDKEKKSAWQRRLEDEGFEDEVQFEQHVKKLEQSVTAAHRKDAGEDTPEEAPPSFPLVDRPDSDLNEEEIKEKKKQRLMKANYEARLRARVEKEKEAERKRVLERLDDDERDRDFQSWSAKLKAEHEAIIEKVKTRKRRQAALSDRKSMAAQQRMRSIANLAAETPQQNTKRRKRVAEDMFGANDDDWQIYRDIQRAADEDDEEEDYARIEALEAKLLAHDATFLPEDTFASRMNARSALLGAFRPIPPETDQAAHFQIVLNTERVRVPEAWFSPGVAGVDCAGVGEVLVGMLKGFGDVERDRLIRNIHVTGGPSQIPGLADRLHNELVPYLPVGAALSVHAARDARLDAWHGMAQFSLTPELPNVSMTRAMYDEWGSESVRAWRGGNWNGAVDVDGVIP